MEESDLLLELTHLLDAIRQGVPATDLHVEPPEYVARQCPIWLFRFAFRNSFPNARQDAIDELIIQKHARSNQLLNQQSGILDLAIRLRTQNNPERSDDRHVVSGGAATGGAVIEHRPSRTADAMCDHLGPRSQCSMLALTPTSSTRYFAAHSRAAVAIGSLS